MKNKILLGKQVCYYLIVGTLPKHLYRINYYYILNGYIKWRNKKEKMRSIFDEDNVNFEGELNRVLPEPEKEDTSLEGFVSEAKERTANIFDEADSIVVLNPEIQLKIEEEIDYLKDSYQSYKQSLIVGIEDYKANNGKGIFHKYMEFIEHRIEKDDEVKNQKEMLEKAISPKTEEEFMQLAEQSLDNKIYSLESALEFTKQARENKEIYDCFKIGYKFDNPMTNGFIIELRKRIRKTGYKNPEEFNNAIEIGKRVELMAELFGDSEIKDTYLKFQRSKTAILACTSDVVDKSKRLTDAKAGLGKVYKYMIKRGYINGK